MISLLFDGALKTRSVLETSAEEKKQEREQRRNRVGGERAGQCRNYI